MTGQGAPLLHPLALQRTMIRSTWNIYLSPQRRQLIKHTLICWCLMTSHCLFTPDTSLQKEPQRQPSLPESTLTMGGTKSCRGHSVLHMVLPPSLLSPQRQVSLVKEPRVPHQPSSSNQRTWHAWASTQSPISATPFREWLTVGEGQLSLRRALPTSEAAENHVWCTWTNS